MDGPNVNTKFLSNLNEERRDQELSHEDMAKHAKAVWHKIVTITEFWVGLPKSKQPGLGQHEKNSNYDHLLSCYKDPLVPVKLQFFEFLKKSLNL